MKSAKFALTYTSAQPRPGRQLPGIKLSHNVVREAAQAEELDSSLLGQGAER